MGLKYYVIDTETTGLKAGYHEITQISIIRCDDRNQLSMYIKAEYPERANREALQITNRTIEDIQKGISKEEAVEKVNNFILSDGLTSENRCFIGHNASFDQRFTAELWRSVGKTFPATCWMDTVKLAKLWGKKLGLVKPKTNLEAALEFTGIKSVPGPKHNAITDSQNTYLLWKKGMDEGLDHLSCIKRYGDE